VTYYWAFKITEQMEPFIYDEWGMVG